IRSAWKCSSKKCWRLKVHHGTSDIGPFKDEAKPPIILECGHYLCDGCTKRVKGGDYYCEIPECKRKVAKEDNIETFPRAKHIREYVNVFRGDGIPCHECRNDVYQREFDASRSNLLLEFLYGVVTQCRSSRSRQRAEREMARAKTLTYRHNIDMIVICKQEGCTSGYLPHMLHCFVCAGKYHIGHDVDRVKHLHQLLQDNPHIPNEYFTQPEVIEGRSNTPQDRFPWNLITISREKTKKFLDELLRCKDCKQPYMAATNSNEEDKSPVFLSCGHLVCKECEKKYVNDDKSCNRDNCREEHRGVTVKNLPADIEYLFNLNVDQYKKCTSSVPGYACDSYFPPEFCVQKDDTIVCVFHNFFPDMDEVDESKKVSAAAAVPR
ncbi:hypothetical protein PFISCL1PPCAC_16023, partial [Pristionchus fissidentatus]